MEILVQDISAFPKTFRLLQQEAILCRSCILTGLEHLLKGRIHGDQKGHYYSAFFQLSIGLERMMKLVYIAHYMLTNDIEAIDEKHLKKLGHNLQKLYESAAKVAVHYDSNCFGFTEVTKLDLSLLVFFDSFASATGRYYNISNLHSENSIDPIVKWRTVIDKIAKDDFSERLWNALERSTAKFARVLATGGVKFPEGYMDDVFADKVNERANYFAVWHIINLMKPLAETLDGVSMSLHHRDTQDKNGYNYPEFPYFDEFFDFCYYSKKDILKIKKWIE